MGSFNASILFKTPPIFYRQNLRRDFIIIKNLQIKHTGTRHQRYSGPTTTNTCLSLARHPYSKDYRR